MDEKEKDETFNELSRRIAELMQAKENTQK